MLAVHAILDPTISCISNNGSILPGAQDQLQVSVQEVLNILLRNWIFRTSEIGYLRLLRGKPMLQSVAHIEVSSECIH